MEAKSRQRSTPDQAVLERYLRRQSADGVVYLKSRFIAEDLELSPSQVGQLMARLADSMTDLDVERWAYSGATTWRVSRQ